MDFDTRSKPPVALSQRQGATWRECLGMDYRSLALFRVLIGLVIVFDMLDRWPDLYAWYSDEGILSRENLLSEFWDPSYISIHMVNGSLLFQQLLMLVQIVSGFFLTIGYYTTTNTVLSWYLHISQQIRNPLVLHNGDVYIRCFLFFAMFLPLGKFWTVDNWLKGKPRKQRTQTYLANVCTISSIIMLSIVYIASFIHKYENAWNVWFIQGDATYYALNLRFFRRPLGDLILSLGRPMIWLFGQAVLYFEGFGPMFLVSPFNHTASRLFASWGIAALHMGFGFAMRLDVFYMTGIACPMSMLPAWWWDTFIPGVYRRFDKRRTFLHAGTLWFDRRSLTVANFFVHMGLHMNLKARFVDADAGDLEAPAGKAGLTGQVWLRYVNDESGQESINLQAAADCCRASILLWPAYWLLTTFPSLWRASETGLQVHNRLTADIPRTLPPRRRARRPALRATDLAAAFFIWFCLAWNGGNLGFNHFPQTLRWVGLSTHLYQSWNMFCPPPTQDWHHRVVGVLASNMTVDIMSDHGFIDWKIQNFTGFDRIPELTTLYEFLSFLFSTSRYATNRWHKLWEGVTFGRPWNDMMKVEVGRYVCREWNKRYRNSPHTLMRHKFHLMTTPTRLDGIVDPWRDEVIHSHSCF